MRTIIPVDLKESCRVGPVADGVFATFVLLS